MTGGEIDFSSRKMFRQLVPNNFATQELRQSIPTNPPPFPLQNVNNPLAPSADIQAVPKSAAGVAGLPSTTRGLQSNRVVTDRRITQSILWWLKCKFQFGIQIVFIFITGIDYFASTKICLSGVCFFLF